MGINCFKATEPIQQDKTSEGWKAELTLEPVSGFEPGTPGLGIQHLTHQAIAPPVFPPEMTFW